MQSIKPTGKPLFELVYESALSILPGSSDGVSVCVLSPSEEVQQHCLQNQIPCRHYPYSWIPQNGTERVYQWVSELEVASESPFGWDDIVVNLQVDQLGMEPGVWQALIAAVSGSLSDNPTKAATVFSTRNEDHSVISNQNRVCGAVVDKKAVGFSRFHPYPMLNLITPEQAEKEYESREHFGVYAYRYRALKNYVQYGVCPQELQYSMEQLRWLDMGESYAAVYADLPPGINVPEDLKGVESGND